MGFYRLDGRVRVFKRVKSVIRLDYYYYCELGKKRSPAKKPNNPVQLNPFGYVKLDYILLNSKKTMNFTPDVR